MKTANLLLFFITASVACKKTKNMINKPAFGENGDTPKATQHTMHYQLGKKKKTDFN